MKSIALLVLEDGTVFQGVPIGCKGQTIGELVFNTTHVGYQESLTDPSYTSQLIVFTSPHIGNVGCNFADEESKKFCAAGIILREKPTPSSNWRSELDFQAYLEKHQIVGIAEIDTRKLTHKLRNQGNIKACITSNNLDVESAKQLALAFNQHQSADLIHQVTTPTSYTWQKNEKNQLRTNFQSHIVVYDFGVKQNILRMLVSYGCKITVVPATTPAQIIKELQPDGIVLSNGPGDPTAFTQQIEMIKLLMTFNIPLLGVCLGHQLLGLASGATISKLKFGHHGINHPIQDLNTGAVFINSQNHNFVIDDQNLPKELSVSHRSLFDGSIQGISHNSKPIWGRQGHPEGSPGPVLPELIEEFLSAATFFSQHKFAGSTTCHETLI